MVSYTSFLLLAICAFASFTSALKVKTISEAREEFTDRQRRASARDGESTVVRGNPPGIVFGNTSSLVFRAGCILMETEEIMLWARPPGSISLSLDADITGATFTVTGSCDDGKENGTASITVSFGAAPNTTVRSGSFSMKFTRDVWNWYMTEMNLTVTYSSNNDTKEPISVKDESLDTEELYGSFGASYYCNEPSITNFASFRRVDEVNTTYGLQFGRVIFQAFLNDTTSTFDPCEPCEYAFTIGLWMAVITGLIMFMIMFFGISMLGSIRTMDRFDDPKTSKLLSVPNE